jgi:D-alanine-D-alanine ligase
VSKRYSAELFGKVAVIMGGNSHECSASIKTGNQVYQSLTHAGIDACCIDLNDDYINELKIREISRVFIATHGGFGENGGLQSLLDSLQIPYTGSGALACALSMDKIISKYLWQANGISTADGLALQSVDNFDIVEKSIGFPCVVKPSGGGSSIGISFVSKTHELHDAYDYAQQYDTKVIIEKYIEGPEYTVCIFNQKIFPVVYISTQGTLFDNKITDKPNTAKYIVPAPLSVTEQAEMQALAKKAYDTIGCKGCARIDIKKDSQGELSVLEINVIPSMRENGLVYTAVTSEATSFDDFVVELLAETL